MWDNIFKAICPDWYRSVPGLRKPRRWRAHPFDVPTLFCGFRLSPWHGCSSNAAYHCMQRRGRTVRPCLLSVPTVLWSYYPPAWCCCNTGHPRSISQRNAGRIAAVLLFVLALIVASTAVLSLVFHLRPETSFVGMMVTVAALVAMPILAWLKRREARRSQQCCARSRRCSVSHLRLPGSCHLGRPGRERGIPYSMV